jgi:uncharacterized membrane protein YccC
VTDRDITGDVKPNMSAYRKAQAIAKERGLLDADLRAIADGVREFDAQRSLEQRSLAALEKIASNTAPDRDPNADSRGWEERRLRRREVYAQELLAVAYLADDVNAPELEAIRATAQYQRLVDRLTGRDGPGHGDGSPT